MVVRFAKVVVPFFLIPHTLLWKIILVVSFTGTKKHQNYTELFGEKLETICVILDLLVNIIYVQYKDFFLLLCRKRKYLFVSH